MKFQESTRKFILLGFALLVIFGLIVVSLLGKKQDEKFLTEHAVYNQAVEHLQEGNYEYALQLAESIENEYRTNELVNYIIGLSATKANQPEKGVRHMQRALAINPHNIEDPIFMLQFAESLVISKDFVNAQIVLDKCLEFKAPKDYENYKEHVTQLLDQLKTDL